jgi:hypothetical protein
MRGVSVVKRYCRRYVAVSSVKVIPPSERGIPDSRHRRRKSLAPYNDHFMPESARLSPENKRYWEIYKC